MEVNRFLCFKKKKILKLKPCLLGDWGMPGSGVCVRRGREVQRLVPNTSSGTHSWMQRLLGAVGSFAGRVSTTTGLGEPSRQKVRVGSLSSCSSWSEPRAHTCTPCFRRPGADCRPQPQPPLLQSWGSLEFEAPGPGPPLGLPASGTLEGGREGTLRAVSGLEKVIEGPDNTFSVRSKAGRVRTGGAQSF